MPRESIEDKTNSLLLLSDSKLPGLYDRKQEYFSFRRRWPRTRFLDPGGLQVCERLFSLGLKVMRMGMGIGPVQIVGITGLRGGW